MKKEFLDEFDEFIEIIKDLYALQNELQDRPEELLKKVNESTKDLIESDQNTPYCAITKKDFGEPMNKYLSFTPFNSNCWVDIETAQLNGLSLKNEEKAIGFPLGNDQKKYLINYEQLNEESKQKITLKPENSDLTKTWKNIPKLDDFIKNIGIKIYKNAYKYPFSIKDEVHMLPDNQFKNEKQYYSVLFHEIAHATGMELERSSGYKKEVDIFEKIDYNKEELVAEFSSYLLLKKNDMEDKLATAIYLNSYLVSSKQEYATNALITDEFDPKEHIKYAVKESAKVIKLVESRGNNLEQNNNLGLNDISNFLNNPNECSNLLKLSENRAQHPNEFDRLLKNYIIEATKENTLLNPPEKVRSYFANKTSEEKTQEFSKIVIDKINNKTVEVLQQARMNNDNSPEIQKLKNSYIATSNHLFKANKEMSLKSIEKNNSLTKDNQCGLSYKLN